MIFYVEDKDGVFIWIKNYQGLTYPDFDEFSSANELITKEKELVKRFTNEFRKPY